jgi:hypothetical protein
LWDALVGLYYDPPLLPTPPTFLIYLMVRSGDLSVFPSSIDA